MLMKPMEREPPIISYYLLIFTGKNITRDEYLNLYLNLNNKTYTSAYGKKKAAGAINFFISLSVALGLEEPPLG